jgi:hypothetical protein
MKTPNLKERLYLVVRTFLYQSLYYAKYFNIFPAFVANIALFAITLFAVILLVISGLASFFVNEQPELVAGLFLFLEQNQASIRQGLDSIGKFFSYIIPDWSFKEFIFKFYFWVSLLFYFGVRIYEKITGKELKSWSFKYFLKVIGLFLLGILIIFPNTLSTFLWLFDEQNRAYSTYLYYIGIGTAVTCLVAFLLNIYAFTSKKIIDFIIKIFDKILQKVDDVIEQIEIEQPKQDQNNN